MKKYNMKQLDIITKNWHIRNDIYFVSFDGCQPMFRKIYEIGDLNYYIDCSFRNDIFIGGLNPSKELQKLKQKYNL